MFTGIIEELGTVKELKKGAASATLKVQASKVAADLGKGDSISVNGVCLTVVEFSKAGFTAEAMAETLRATNLGGLRPGDRVNLERALSPSGRLGGHIVSGHVDGVGAIKSVVREDIAQVFTVEAPEAVMRYIIKKGSIAVDGISLTVVDFEEGSFSVSIIPHTAKETTLGIKKTGDRVNLEPDLIAKYVERLFPGGKGGPGKGGSGGGGIGKGFLAEHGFM
jgi:riboflavin synthase